MNQLGKDYMSKVDHDFAGLNKDVKKEFIEPSNEQVYERCMRLGVETKRFDLLNSNEIEAIAAKTIKEDFYKQAKLKN